MLRISLSRELATEFVGMVTLHPSQIGVGGRLLFPDEGDERRTQPAESRPPTATDEVRQAADRRESDRL